MADVTMLGDLRAACWVAAVPQVWEGHPAQMGPIQLWRAVEMGTRDVLCPGWVSGDIAPGSRGGQWSVLTWLQAKGAKSPKSSDP